MKNDLPAPVTQRLDWLEADASAQRTAILRLEWRVEILAGAIAFACIAVIALLIVLEMLT